MFQANMCPSSGETTVFMRHLVYLLFCVDDWLVFRVAPCIPVSHTKNKWIKNKLCTDLVLFTRIYRDARSTKHETFKYVSFSLYLFAPTSLLETNKTFVFSSCYVFPPNKLTLSTQTGSWRAPFSISPSTPAYTFLIAFSKEKLESNSTNKAPACFRTLWRGTETNIWLRDLHYRFPFSTLQLTLLNMCLSDTKREYYKTNLSSSSFSTTTLCGFSRFQPGLAKFFCP